MYRMGALSFWMDDPFLVISVSSLGLLRNIQVISK
jgi:hypothetical protein